MKLFTLLDISLLLCEISLLLCEISLLLCEILLLLGAIRLTCDSMVWSEIWDKSYP